MNRHLALIFLVIFSNNLLKINCQITDDTTTTTTTTTTATTTTTITPLPTNSSTSSTSKPVSTTSLPTDECSVNQNATCKECLQNEKCFFCNEDNTCRHYKLSGIFPQGCSASHARWISCSLDMQALLIAVISIGVIIILIVGCCVCYCCNKTCKSISDRSLRRVEKKIAKQRDLLKQRNQAKREERQSKNEAIRIKYGLKPATYSPMDN